MKEGAGAKEETPGEGTEQPDEGEPGELEACEVESVPGIAALQEGGRLVGEEGERCRVL